MIKSYVYIVFFTHGV